MDSVGGGVTRRRVGGLVLLGAALVGGCGERGVVPVDATVVDAAIAAEDQLVILGASEIVCVDGATPTPLTLTSAVTSSEAGPTTPIAASWALRSDSFGTLDRTDGETVTFTPRCDRFGVLDIDATARLAGTPRAATHRLRVRWEHVIDRLPGDLHDAFTTSPVVDDPIRSATLLYPLDEAVVPNNWAAPSVQWSPTGARGDAYRLRVVSEHVTLTMLVADVSPTFRSAVEVDRDAWRALTASLVDHEGGLSQVDFSVDRFDRENGEVVSGTPVRVSLSEDGVFGSLFYWRVQASPQASDVFRLNTVTGERASVFGTESGACVGCHALSNDGRTLAATVDFRGPARVTAVVDTTRDATPPPDVFAPLSPAYHLLAFSPDASRILASRPEGDESLGQSRLALLDGETGQPRSAVGLPTANAGYPAWSPDGRWIAWMEGGSDGPVGTADATSIELAHVEAGDTFAPATTLVGGASLEASLEGGQTVSRPTFSPDGRFVVFAHGTRSVSASDTETPAHAALYLVPVEGGAPIRLARGMGPDGPVDAFWPVYSPFVTEEPDGTELHWLAFYSRQSFGNARAGTLGTSRRQLWVMAIDPARIEAGADPSHAPYWLDGQDVSAENIAALWAPTACRARGEDCTASSECCSGACLPEPTSGRTVCAAPPVCHRYGESCETADDCCDGLSCSLHVCGYEPPS